MVFCYILASVSQRALLSGIPVSGDWSFGKQGIHYYVLFFLHALFFMRSLPNSVGQGIMFSGCPSAAFDSSFIRLDRSRYHNIL